MKKLCLVLIGILLFAALPLYAQVTLQVNWVPASIGLYAKATNALELGTTITEDSFVKGATMEVYVDGRQVSSLRYKESKEITLSSGNHTLYVRIPSGHGSWTLKSETISFNANSGRVIYNATPKEGIFKDSLELVNATSSSQPQSVAQQPQANNNQPRTNSGTTNQSSNSQSTNTRQSLGNLRNTTWVAYSYGSMGFFYEGTETIDFGNGNYRYTLQGTVNGFPTSSTETGTYTVSGDNVIFTSNGEKTIIGGSDGKQTTGSIIGNSLTVGGSTYRRQ